MIEKLRAIAITLVAFLMFSSFPVWADDLSDLQTVLGMLTFANLSTEDANAVTQNLTLPDVLGDGINLKWSSSRMDVVVPSGSSGIVCPTRLDEDVTLTVVADKGAATLSKSFDITVAQRTIPIIEAAFGYDFTGYTTATLPTSGTKYFSFTTTGSGTAGVEADPVNASNSVLAVDCKNGGTDSGKVEMFFPAVGRTASNDRIIIECDLYNAGGMSNALYAFHNDTINTPVLNVSTMADGVFNVRGGNGTSIINDAQSGKWNHFYIEVDFNSTSPNFKTYVNGEYAYTGFTFRTAATLIKRLYLYKVTTQTGKLYADNIKVYNDPYFTVDKASENLSLGNGLNQVTGNITLPSTISGYAGAAVQWVSSNPDIISNNGVVTRPSADSAAQKVKLAAVISTAAGKKTSKVFEATVLPLQAYSISSVPAFSTQVLTGNEEISVSTEIKKENTTARNVMLILALYDINHQLVSVHMDTSSSQLQPGQTEILTTSLPVGIVNGHKLRTFLWADNMEPLDNVLRILQ